MPDLSFSKRINAEKSSFKRSGSPCDNPSVKKSKYSQEVECEQEIDWIDPIENITSHEPLVTHENLVSKINFDESHPLDRATSTTEVVYMMYDQLMSVKEEQQKQMALLQQNISFREKKKFDFPNSNFTPIVEPSHSTLAKIIYDFAFNPGEGIVLGVIYEDMTRNIEDRYKIAIHKNLLLDFVTNCFPSTKHMMQQYKRIDTFLDKITYTTEWSPSIDNMTSIKQHSTAVPKKSDDAEQKLWFQFSLHNFLTLRERANLYFPDDPVFVAPLNGYVFDPKKWSHEKEHMMPGNPFLRSYYINTPIHTVLEKKNQRDIMKLFVNYQGDDVGILNVKKYVMNSLFKNGTFPFWSGTSTMTKYIEIWIKGHTKQNEICDKEDMKQIWNNLFSEKYPGEDIDRSKPIYFNWTQRNEVIPHQQKNPCNPPLQKSPGKKKKLPSVKTQTKNNQSWIDQLEKEL